MKYPRRYFGLSIFSFLLILAIRQYQESYQCIQHKVEEAQNSFNNVYHRFDADFLFFDSLSSKLRDWSGSGGVLIYKYSSDSLVYWNEEKTDPSIFFMDHTVRSKFISIGDQTCYFEKRINNNNTWLIGYLIKGMQIVDESFPKASVAFYGPHGEEVANMIPADKLSVAWQIGILFLYIIALFAGIYAAYLWSNSFLMRKKILTALAAFSGLVFLLRFISLQIINNISFDKIILFDKNVQPSYLSPTLGDMMINIFILCIVIWFIRNFVHPQFISSGKKGIALLNYWMVYVSTFLMVLIFKQLVWDSGLSFDFEYIFYLDLSSLIALSGILLLVIALFVFDHHLLRIIRHLGLKPKERLIINCVALFACFPLVLFFKPSLPVILLLLGMASYLSLLDLFVDRMRPRASWYLTWVITGSILVSSILYNFHIDKEWQERKYIASQILQEIKNHSPGSADVPVLLKQIMKQKESAFSGLAFYTIDFISHKPPQNQILELNTDLYKYKTNGDAGPVLYADLKELGGFALAKKSNQLFKAISFFSYIFILFNLIIFVLLIINNSWKFLPWSKSSFFPSRHTLRYRIQISMLLVSICSFLLIAIVLVIYFKQTSPDLREAKRSPSAEELRNQLNALSNPSSEILENQNYELFDSRGFAVKAESENLRMPFDDFLSLKWKEKNGSLAAFIAKPFYSSVDWQGHTYYASLHSLGSDLFEKRRLNDFLGTLLNVYVFLLIIVILISVVVSNSITKPLTILSSKLRLIQVGGTNSKLEWNRKDELGGLIHNYNEMIQELDRSTRMLAHTERESAWREMAKQVAHEIKNPLTPMKLITQHLQNSISRTEPEDISALVKRVTQTLIEQIENLSKIANEFSNFAKLPAPENEKLVLNEVVTSTHDLFRKRDDMDIHLRVPIDEIYIFADKNHVIRVLTNLVKNAIQAIPLGRRGKIEISLFKNGDMAVIKVNDNGCGIPESMKDKVFYPNFTTKNSGTGLGLAIVRDIVDSFNGRIYFNTSENIGTDFFIELPLMHMQDNFRVVERVSL